jgi:hypothetical protein
LKEYAAIEVKLEIKILTNAGGGLAYYTVIDSQSAIDRKPAVRNIC